MAGDETKTFKPGELQAERMPDQSGEKGDLNDTLIQTSTWFDEYLTDAGIPVVDVPLVSVGGGLGSFALVDTLRIAGVEPKDIKVLTDLKTPHETYEYLATNSQIPRHERLRSDSGSVMDNI